MKGKRLKNRMKKIKWGKWMIYMKNYNNLKDKVP